MKKIYIFLICVFGLLLTGCGNSFDSYFKLVNLPEVVEDELYLPAELTNDGKHDVYWKSSDPDAIRISSSNIVPIDGLLYYTTQIEHYEVEIEVTLTMTIDIVNKGSETRDFVVKVAKLNQVVDEDIINFQFYGINDFHGAVYSDKGGLSKLGNYIIKEKERHPNTTVLIASGDMFQGSAISNMTHGGVVVEAMNEIGFDAMCMGNHEFDWGIDIIRDYNNKTTDPVANFPIICCNIYERSTNKPVDWCEPYTIIERSGIKIGIIGAMGSELETSIAQNRIEPFEFVDHIPLVKNYTKFLRTEMGCEIVVLTIHDNTDGSINTTYADLTGDYQLDAVFNGHTHATYAGETLGSDGIRMPFLQSGSYGSAIGKIVLSYNKKTKTLVDSSAENILMHRNICESNEKLDKIIKKYDDLTAPIANEVLGVSATKVDQPTCARWAANVIKEFSGCQVGFINSGGIRGGAFPINRDEEVTVSRVWQIMPFDNLVKTCTMKASDVAIAYKGYDMVHSTNCTLDSNGNVVIDGKTYSKDEEIRVAAVDYVFDKPTFPFQKGTDKVNTGKLFRDYLIESIRNECKNGSKWQCK